MSTQKEILEERRDRFENKQEQRLERAERLAQKHRLAATQRYESAKGIGDQIPFGQPILVGHHSEKRHRRDVERIDQNMRKSIEHQEKATYYEGKAHAIAHNRAISSDDPEAIQKLQEKLDCARKAQEWMKTVNQLWRKAKKPTADNDQGWAIIAEGLELNINHETIQKLRLDQARDCLDRAPFTYHLQNNNAEIKRLEKRIQSLKEDLEIACVQEEETQRYDDLHLTVVWNYRINRLQLCFDNKPEKAIRDIVKSCGFRWAKSEMAWQRKLGGSSDFGLSRALSQLQTLNQ